MRIAVPLAGGRPCRNRLVAVIAQCRGCPSRTADQSSIVGFDRRAHVEDGYPILADRQPIAADRAVSFLLILSGR